jgi:hypothetical protein
VAVLFVGGMLMVGGGVWMDLRSTDDPVAWWRDSHMFAIMGCLTAILLWGCGTWTWWIGSACLSIDLKTGAVAFGSRQICGPGTVNSVLLRRDSNPDALEPYCFEFRLIDGTIMRVPSPCFAGIRKLAQASELAEQLGEKLNVRVVHDS